MYVKRLSLTSFRNFASLALELPPGCTILKGRNAQGKTNFLESICVLSQLKSPRTNKLRELVTAGCEIAAIEGTIEDKYGDLSLAVVIENGRRRSLINDKPVTKVEEALGKLVTVSFFPSELTLVKGPPLGRRQFILRHLIDVYPNLVGAVLQYYRAMAQKNALLKSGGRLSTEIYAWNQILYREGTAIQRGLCQLVSELGKYVTEIFAGFTADDGGICLDLETTAFIPEDPSAAEVAFQQSLAREQYLQRSLLGPHRCDLRIDIGGIDARAYASQGQARSIVLALKLGVIKLIETSRRESPVVLLDDVESELDHDRSERFFQILAQGGTQIVLTCTDKAFSALKGIPEAHVLEVDSGALLRPHE